MRRFFVLAAVLAVVLAGCKIETNVNATIDADGTGTVAYEIGLDDEAMRFFTQSGEDPFADAPADATTRTEERDGMTYYIIEQTFDGADELIRLMTEEDDSPFETFSASFSASEVSVSGTTGDTGGGMIDPGELEGFDPGLIEESFSASVKITMPGEVTSSNADSQDGSTLTWDVPLLGGALEIQAQSDPTKSGGGGGGFPAWLIVVIAVLVVAAIGFFVMNRRKPAASAPAAAAPADAPAPAPITPAAPAAAEAPAAPDTAPVTPQEPEAPAAPDTAPVTPQEPEAPAGGEEPAGTGAAGEDEAADEDEARPEGDVPPPPPPPV